MDEVLKEILELAKTEGKISAVKRYRELTGAGLAEAKLAVEQLQQAHFSGPGSAESSAELSSEVVALLGQGNKIDAIKLYRDRTGFGLKHAKAAVERIGRENGIEMPAGQGCFSILLIGGLVLWQLLAMA